MNSKLSEALSESVRVSSWMVCPAQPDDKFVFFESGAFYAGDAMTMVHPVVGGGIPIAIAGSAMLGSLADEAEKNNWNEERLVREYSGAWKRRFGQRALLASLIGRAERSDLISKLLFSIFGVLPDAFPALMRRTRRDPVLAS